MPEGYITVITGSLRSEQRRIQHLAQRYPTAHR